MSSSLTTLIVFVTLIHVAAFVVMTVIRVRRNEVEGTALRSPLTPMQKGLVDRAQRLTGDSSA